MHPTAPDIEIHVEGVTLLEPLSAAKHRDLGQLKRDGALVTAHGDPVAMLAAAGELLDRGEWRWAQLLWLHLRATPSHELGDCALMLNPLHRRIVSVRRRSVAMSAEVA